MLSVNLGPFALSSHLLLLLVAGLMAAGVGHWVGRGQQTGLLNTLLDMLIAAVLAARIAFVIIWYDSYRASPWSMLDIRDGGFTAWAGVIGALAVAIWRGWRLPLLRKPLIVGLAAGALGWGAMSAVLRLTERPELPDITLMRLDGEPAQLARLAAGKPLVVNLWATWCPPCRREMPVLAAAQKRQTGVRFVFVNQGEPSENIQHYLHAAELHLDHVLLDPGTRLALAVGSRALPTTLFYDGNGRLVDTHLGALSAASLSSKLARLRTP